MKRVMAIVAILATAVVAQQKPQNLNEVLDRALGRTSGSGLPSTPSGRSPFRLDEPPIDGTKLPKPPGPPSRSLPFLTQEQRIAALERTVTNMARDMEEMKRNLLELKRP